MTSLDLITERKHLCLANKQIQNVARSIWTTVHFLCDENQYAFNFSMVVAKAERGVTDTNK